MKNLKKVLAIALAAVMLLSLVTLASAADKTYTDAAVIEQNGQTEAVDVLSYLGILNGYGDGAFRTNQGITRAEAAKIIAMFKNGATDIDALYTAANPFADCKGSWAESYVAYCYKTGIIGGVGGNLYAPSAKVTGIQYLKMVLIVLGYNAKSEGLEGPSWAVNTLALAKRACLLDGLGDSFDVSANLLRGQAAQIMLNALNAHTVEYGQAFMFTTAEQTQLDKLGSLRLNGYNFLTVAGAIDTGRQLMEAWDLSVAYAYDVWGAPNHSWYKGTTKFVTYDDKPVLTYTKEVKYCDILVDLGIAKTSTSTKTVDYVAQNGALLYDTNVNSFVDTYNRTATPPQTYADLLLRHNASDKCLTNVGKESTYKTIGGTGTLTRVFKLNSGKYAIVAIDTYFAQVMNVAASAHGSDATLTMTVWMNGFSEDAGENYGDLGDRNVKTTHFSGTWAKYDYALVYRLGNLNADKRVVGETDFGGTPGGVYVQSKTAAAATAVLKKYTREVSTTVGDKTYPDNRNFDLGYPGETGTTYNVYTDSYGNAIALIIPAKVYSYGVIDRIAWEHKGALGNPLAQANLVLMDTSKVDSVTMAGIVEDTEEDGTDYTAFSNHPTNSSPDYKNATVSSNWPDNTSAYGSWLYQFTSTEAGYVITAKGLGTKTQDITRSVPTNVASGINTNDSTVYLVKTLDADGNIVYKTYTGYKNIPSIEGATLSYFADNNVVTRMVVDATGAQVGFDSTLYYIPDDDPDGADGSFLTYNMYLGDVLKPLTSTATGLENYEGPGLYMVKTNEAGQITGITRIDMDKDSTGYIYIDRVKACDGTVIENAKNIGINITPAAGMTPPAFYLIKNNNTITAIDPTDGAYNGYPAFCVLNSSKQATAVYFMEIT